MILLHPACVASLVACVPFFSFFFSFVSALSLAFCFVSLPLAYDAARRCIRLHLSVSFIMCREKEIYLPLCAVYICYALVRLCVGQTTLFLMREDEKKADGEFKNEKLKWTNEPRFGWFFFGIFFLWISTCTLAPIALIVRHRRRSNNIK